MTTPYIEAKKAEECWACANPDGEGKTYCLDHYHA